MCSGPNREASPSKEAMEAELQKQISNSKYSILLEFSASDDLESFKSTVEETLCDIDETGLWYGRKTGSRKMGFEERTPLMIASMYGSKKVIKYIIESGKADVNRACGSDNATALHCAAAGGSSSALEAVKLLLEASADPGSLNSLGNRPADLVSFGPSPKTKAVETLLAKKEYPVDVSLPDINNGVYGSDEFRMYSFKIKPCSRAYSHDWTECPFVHPGENARRRDPRKYPYSCVPCPEFRKNSCLKGDSCEYAHGVFESWLHPAQYRTRLCKDETGCARKVCFFAHRVDELRPVYASTGSAVPASMSPRAHGDMAGLTLSPPMSPKNMNLNLNMSLNSMTPPMIQLPGSRLKTALCARDLGFEMELLGLDSPKQQNQLRSSYPSMSCSSPIRKPVSLSSYGLESSMPSSMSSRAAAFKQQRSQSFVDRGASQYHNSHNNHNHLGFTAAANSAMMSPSSFSEWGSPDRKPDWAVQGDELTKLRKSASFGFRNSAPRANSNANTAADEPDVSWVNSLVKDVPAENYHNNNSLNVYNQSQSQNQSVHHHNQMSKGVHEVLPPWVEQLYIEQEQLVA